MQILDYYSEKIKDTKRKRMAQYQAICIFNYVKIIMRIFSLPPKLICKLDEYNLFFNGKYTRVFKLNQYTYDFSFSQLKRNIKVHMCFKFSESKKESSKSAVF